MVNPYQNQSSFNTFSVNAVDNLIIPNIQPTIVKEYLFEAKKSYKFVYKVVHEEKVKKNCHGLLQGFVTFSNKTPHSHLSPNHSLN